LCCADWLLRFWRDSPPSMENMDVDSNLESSHLEPRDRILQVCFRLDFLKFPFDSLIFNLVIGVEF